MTPHQYKRRPIWTETQTLFFLPSVFRPRLSRCLEIGHLTHFGQWFKKEKLTYSAFSVKDRG